MAQNNDNNGKRFASQYRTPIFIINMGTLIGMAIVLPMIFLYLFEGRGQNEAAIQTGEDAKFQAELTKNQSIQNGADIEKVNQTVVYLNQSFFAFVDNFYDRQQIGNERANATLEGFNNLTMYLREVLKQQLQNEVDIQSGVDNVIGNLTQHRIIQNITRDDDVTRQNQTLTTLKELEVMTKTLITQFNMTNEQERDKAIDVIINNLTAVIENQSSRIS